MCEASGKDPYEAMEHEGDYRPTMRGLKEGQYVMDYIQHSSRWVMYAWAAEKWIFTETGEMP